MKKEILALLKKQEGFLSGQMLCDKFQVSRTAVWKVVKQLKEEGYKIEAVSNKGYRLLSSPDILIPEELESHMETKKLGRKVCFFQVTDSTNTQAKYLAERSDSDGLLITAEHQTGAKGRRGRSWESPSGTGIWMTLILKPEISPNGASLLTLVAALAVSQAIEECTKIKAQIKWPNDIIYKGKKICGILTEMSTAEDTVNYIVIGIGINVNIKEFSEELKEKATSLQIETGKRVNRVELAAKVIKRLEEWYEIFLKTGDMRELKKPYEERLVNLGKKVKIEIGNKEGYEALAVGINKNGELIVRLENGEEKTIIAGEVSVRGVYGYI